MNEEKFFTPLSERKKADRQDRKTAKKIGARVTVNSGATFSNGDMEIPELKIRIEAKRTDAEQITLKSEWMKKIAAQSRFEMPVLHITIGADKQEWYVIRPEEFALLLGFLQKAKEDDDANLG